MALSKILVPPDGSSLAEKALPTASARGQRSNAAIRLAAVPGLTYADHRPADSVKYFATAAESLQQQDRET